MKAIDESFAGMIGHMDFHIATFTMQRGFKFERKQYC